MSRISEMIEQHLIDEVKEHLGLDRDPTEEEIKDVISLWRENSEKKGEEKQPYYGPPGMEEFGVFD